MEPSRTPKEGALTLDCGHHNEGALTLDCGHHNERAKKIATRKRRVRKTKKSKSKTKAKKSGKRVQKAISSILKRSSVVSKFEKINSFSPGRSTARHQKKQRKIKRRGSKVTSNRDNVTTRARHPASSIKPNFVFNSYMRMVAFFSDVGNLATTSNIPKIYTPRVPSNCFLSLPITTFDPDSGWSSWERCPRAWMDRKWTKKCDSGSLLSTLTISKQSHRGLLFLYNKMWLMSHRIIANVRGRRRASGQSGAILPEPHRQALLRKYVAPYVQPRREKPHATLVGVGFGPYGYDLRDGWRVDDVAFKAPWPTLALQVRV